MQNNGEAGQTSADLFEDVEAEFGLTLELERAVRGADCNGEGVDARLFDKFLNLVGVGVAGVFCVDFDVVLDARELAELRFDDHAVVVCILDDLFGYADIFRKGVRARVNHNRGETAVHTVLAQREAVAVVEVQSNGQAAGFDRRFDHLLR